MCSKTLTQLTKEFLEDFQHQQTLEDLADEPNELQEYMEVCGLCFCECKCVAFSFQPCAEKRRLRNTQTFMDMQLDSLADR